ncbi:CDP-glucose 4,6-dehydratase [Brevibacillus agri]|uniref:CDP-glucose 4,6-dehydratase n=1 Tax=Brevibacillus agri TaxID=51101 RepID=UPI001C8D1B51|nr:CDP-glucose 4,6-dehydratase [Brevibacillus agri]MBY0053481.1 CDP-glucose 4,6-dehydratase [Brevibacillus agri]MED4572922.1 CDP-glucose 4,6-dehydratase [Brevibacillus agri]
MMRPDATFWRGKKVFLTGHTGFKGSWMCLLLHALGARVTGYALPAPTEPGLFALCRIDSLIHSVTGDIRASQKLTEELLAARPDIVIHMAAQPLVGMSYAEPVATYETNVMGTVYLLEAVRSAREAGIPVRALVNVTTDKCYENKEWTWGYREVDTLGGHDPYSNSKACAEFVTACYRASFFQGGTAQADLPPIGIATARAGNVIGGGDFTPGRLVPDLLRSLLDGEPMQLRQPQAIRPWQHVLESLHGYLLLVQKLCEDSQRYSASWNFGPDADDAKTVEWLATRLCEKWGAQATYHIPDRAAYHETTSLKLDSSRARELLHWRPHWTVEQALDRIVEWTRAYQRKEDMRQVCLAHIEQYRKEGAS